MKILVERQTSRQKVILAEQDGYIGLLINGCLQFHGGDQGPLHELLVGLPLCLHPSPKRVLVLGGGIGLTAREALRVAEVERLVLVEIDPELVEITRNHPAMRALHKDAFSDPRVELVIGDAFAYAAQTRERFDLVINAIDVSYTPQNQDMGEQAIRALWRTERALLGTDGWLSDCLNDVEIAEYFAGDLRAALREFPAALGEGLACSLSLHYRGEFAGDHVFAMASMSQAPVEPRRSVPPGCELLSDTLIRRFLRRGFWPR